MNIFTDWVNSAKHALRGVYVLLSKERNAQIHLLMAVITIAFGSYLSISSFEWSLITLCISLVIALEAINTAIERLVDLVSPNWHSLAKDAKDIAAAGVLIASIGTAIVGALIFFPKLFL